MDKDKCGKFGCYGFQDGYSHPQRVCRISGCVDANECSNKLKEDIAGKGKDYIMTIFQNKEKGIQERENETKVRDFTEKEKLRVEKEKMEADEKLKKETEEKTKKEQDEKVANDKKAADELKERAKKVGLPETATQVEVEAKEKEVKDVEELKARAVKVGLPETATLVEIEAKEKEATSPAKEPVKCKECGQVIPEKPAEKPAEEVKPKEGEVPPEEKK